MTAKKIAWILQVRLADAKQAQRLHDATRARLMLAELERTTI